MKDLNDIMLSQIEATDDDRIIPINRRRIVAPGSREEFQKRMRDVKPVVDENGQPYLVPELRSTAIFRQCSTCKCQVNDEDTHGYTKNEQGKAIPCPTCTPQVLRAKGIKKTDAYILLLVEANKLFNTRNLPVNAAKLTMQKYPAHGDQEAKRKVQLFIDGEIKDLFLTGNPGVGKSGLAIAAANIFASQGKQVFMISSSDYIDLLKQNFEHDAKENNIKYIVKNVEVLFYDDLATEGASEFTLKEIQEVIEFRRNAGLRTCITSNLSLKQLEKYWFLKNVETGFQPAARTISRLQGWYEVVTFNGRELR